MILAICLTSLLGAGTAFAIEIDHLEGKTLFFKSAEGEPKYPSLATNLENPKAIGVLKAPAGPPFVLVADDRALFLLRVDGSKKMELVYPGRIVDPKSGLRVLDSQGFYGRCVRDHEDVYVAYQTEVVERKRHKRRVRSTEPSVFMAEPDKDGINEKLSELRSVGSLQSRKKDTLRRVKLKQCFAIDGRNRDVSKTTIKLNNKHDDENDDDDDDTPAPGTPPGTIAAPVSTG